MPIDKEKLRAALPSGTQFNCIIFEEYKIPFGFLDSAPETHALFWYFLNARKVYDGYFQKMEVVLEGDVDPATNFRQLFESIAFQYGVEPENMAKCWDLVDAQARALNMPVMPFENRYRFQSIIVLN